MKPITVSMTKAARDFYAKNGLADNKKLIEYLNDIGGYLGKVVAFTVESEPAYKVDIII